MVLYFSLRSTGPYCELANQQTRLHAAQTGCGLSMAVTGGLAPGSGWGMRGPGEPLEGKGRRGGGTLRCEAGRANTCLCFFLALLPETCCNYWEGTCIFPSWGGEAGISKRPLWV